MDVRHIVAVDGPAEDWPFHAMAFDHAELTLPVPSYSAWWRGRDHPTLCPYIDRVLRLLHSRRPPCRWLLKMPAYLFSLADVAAQHPDVHFVMTHRDPVAAIASDLQHGGGVPGPADTELVTGTVLRPRAAGPLGGRNAPGDDGAGARR